MNEMWYFARGGNTIGPVTLERLRAEITSGRLSRGDLVWRQGMAGWVEAGQVPELLPFFSHVRTNPVWARRFIELSSAPSTAARIASDTRGPTRIGLRFRV
jgi:hypothetical protein